MPVVNIEGIAPGAIKLTGPLLADIYFGKIKKWNDEADRRSQSRASSCRTRTSRSCAARTARARRSCGPTTCPRSAPSGRTRSARSTAVAWPEGVGGKGNEGVASYVQRIKGSIGYVEYAYAKRNKMTPRRGAATRTASSCSRTTDAFQAAAAFADWKSTPGLLPDPDRPARQDQLADHRRVVHPDAREVGQAAEHGRRSMKFFDWAMQERAEDGGGARLRADAGERGQADQRAIGRRRSRTPRGKALWN